jgi:hypothetical protein
MPEFLVESSAGGSPHSTAVGQQDQRCLQTAARGVLAGKEHLMYRFTVVSWPAGRLARAAVVAAGLAVAVGLAGAVPAVAAGGAAGARAGVPGGTWRSAQPVPGLAALNAGRNAQISSLSCSSAGNCGGGGDYFDAAGNMQGFVVSQAHGRWGAAQPVPGLAALNTGGNAAVGHDQVSCRSAGNCSAGGSYSLARTNVGRAFVVSETNGRWGQAQTVTGAVLNASPGADIEALSCGSAGNCAAGGYYAENSTQVALPEQAFVVNQTGGTWGKAQPVHGLRALNAGGQARINALSCGSAGNCSAGGYYTDRSHHTQAFVVTETDGTWGTAEQVPGLAAPNAGASAELDEISCTSAGRCTAAGAYTDGADHVYGFTVTQNKGRWGTAEKIRGAAVNAGGLAAPSFGSLSCAPAGRCSIGGSYADRSGRHFQVYVASRKAGRWGTAAPVPGAAALNTGRNADIASLSCGAAGNCAAVGFYTDSSRHWQAFVADQANGTWGTAQPVPGIAALNAGHGGATYAVSCSSAGHCTAGGFYYTDRSGRHQQAFVVSQG